MPYIRFKNQAEEAVNLYMSLFKDSKLGNVTYNDVNSAPMSGMEVGSILSMEFTLAGITFGALNGGDYYKHTPAVSFFVSCETIDEIDALWAKLSEWGQVLMEYGKYPFSEKYGWLVDKYGISRQLFVGKSAQKISPCLMFIWEQNWKAEAAMNYYTQLFDNSKITFIARYEEGEQDTVGNIKHAQMNLDGFNFIVMESSLDHKFVMTGAVSFLIYCKDQAEIDKFWDAFADGWTPNQCGRTMDKFGVTRQVCPTMLDERLRDPDPAKADRTMKAMMGMIKLDIEGLRKAHDGE